MQTSSTLLATARIKFEDWLLAKGLRRSGERFAILDEVYSRNDQIYSSPCRQNRTGSVGQPSIIRWMY